jgi:hypothetical protein
MSDKKKDADQKDKGKSDKKDKGADKKGKAKKGAPGSGMSVAAHPRAARQIRLAKGWGGLLAFAITAYLSVGHGAPLYLAGGRALVAGMAGRLVASFCAVMVWRQLMIAELRARVERARRASGSPAGAGAAKSAGGEDQAVPATS